MLDLTEDHNIYISTLYMDITDDDINLDIKVFEDDMRSVIQSFTGEIPDTSIVKFEEDVLLYFRKYLTLTSDTDEVRWEFDDIALHGDSYQIKLVARDVFPGLDGRIELSAKYFFELFPTQKNILRLTHQDEKSYHVFKNQRDRYNIFL